MKQLYFVQKIILKTQINPRIYIQILAQTSILLKTSCKIICSWRVNLELWKYIHCMFYKQMKENLCSCSLLWTYTSNYTDVVFKNGILEKFTGQFLTQSLFLMKLQPRAQKLEHRCFPMCFAKILRRTTLKKICKRLLLTIKPQIQINFRFGIYWKTLVQFKIHSFTAISKYYVESLW